jgi:hypothetical protein
MKQVVPTVVMVAIEVQPPWTGQSQVTAEIPK